MKWDIVRVLEIFYNHTKSRFNLDHTQSAIFIVEEIQGDLYYEQIVIVQKRLNLIVTNLVLPSTLIGEGTLIYEISQVSPYRFR